MNAESRAKCESPLFAPRLFLHATHTAYFLPSQMSSAWGSRCAPAPFFAAYVVANSFPSRIRLSASFSTPFAACRLLAA